MDNLPVARDYLFTAAVGMLPDPLARAMRENGLMNPAVLKHYPRLSARNWAWRCSQSSCPQRSRSRDLAGSRRGGLGLYETTPGHWCAVLWLVMVFWLVFSSTEPLFSQLDFPRAGRLIIATITSSRTERLVAQVCSDSSHCE